MSRETLELQPILGRSAISSGPSLQWLDVIPIKAKENAAKKIAKAMRRFLLIKRVERAAYEYRRQKKMKKALDERRIKEEKEREERERQARLLKIIYTVPIGTSNNSGVHGNTSEENNVY